MWPSLGEPEVLAASEKDVVFRNIVPSRVEEERTHHIRCGRHLRICPGIDFHKICETTTVLDPESGRDTFRLGRHDSKRWLWTAVNPRTFLQSLNREMGAIRESTGVRYFAEGIDA